MENIVAEARQQAQSLKLEEVKAAGLLLDRVRDNPEAARYFLAYGDWKPVSAKDVFSNPDRTSAEQTQIYVDLPFCSRMCNFCTFYPVIARDEDQMAEYVTSVKKEIRLLRKIYFDHGFSAGSLELGGGTPTHLPLHLLQDLVHTLFEEFPFIDNGEKNFEATPESIVGKTGHAKLRFLREAGFNRISIGAQSFQDRVLKDANRSHSSDKIYEAYDSARSMNFRRINFDLLLGLANQTMEDFLDSVEKSVTLGVDIIELYTMRYFDTKKVIPLAQRLTKDAACFLNEEDILIARIAADRFLRNAGYTSTNGRTYYKTDSSNEYYSDFYKHNFLGNNVLAVGRKSHSNIYPWQYANYRNMQKYHTALEGEKLPIAAGCLLTPAARLAKLLTGAMQLRETFDYGDMKKGFNADFSKPFDERMMKLVETGYLTEELGVYRKTFLGFIFIEDMLKAVYDTVLSPFSVNTAFLGKTQESS